MNLTKHLTLTGPRWALDGRLLPTRLDLSLLLSLPTQAMLRTLEAACSDEPASGDPQAPIDPEQEVWAAGVTYLRSRQARQAESSVGDVYQRVYDAPRPELFFKSPGWRVSGPAPSRWAKQSPAMRWCASNRTRVSPALLTC